MRTGIRARENRAAELRAQAETVAEQERVRIARDMHDVVAHSLAVVIAQADGARYGARAVRELAKNGYDGWLCVELDKKWEGRNPIAPVPSARMCRTYLRKAGY